MPYLRFKGFEEEFLRENAPLIISEFSRVARLPTHVVKMELLNVVQITESPCSLEIVMFPRERGTHDAIAEVMYDLLSHFGYREVHIFFVLVDSHLYYKEGVSSMP